MIILGYSNSVDSSIFDVHIENDESLKGYLSECRNMMFNDNWCSNDDVFQYMILKKSKECYRQWFGSFCDMWDILTGFDYKGDEDSLDIEFFINKEKGEIHLILGSRLPNEDDKRSLWCSYREE